MGINNSLLKSIQTLIDRAINVAPFDKTRQSQVITNNNNGTYTVRLDGVLYNNVPSYPQVTNITPNTIVKTHLPSNQPNQMYIVPHIETITNLFYPIGSWYQTSLRPKFASSETGVNMIDYFDPEETWGGKWKLLDEGVFLSSAGANHPVSSGTAKDGGSPDAVVVTHTHKTATDGATTTGTKTGLKTGTDGGGTNNITGGSHYHTAHYTTIQRGSGTSNTRSGPFSRSTYPDTHVATGSETHTHNLPAHQHSVADHSHSQVAHSHNVNAPTDGVDGTGKNLPPYKNVYMWYRYA